MKVGLAGTGLKGKPMALKIQKAGFDITVYNRTITKTKELENEGIKVAQTFSELLKNSDVIVVMLSDYSAITNIFFSEKVSFEGKVIVQMSTISPKESILLQQRVSKLGGNYFEAPVLGSIQQIEEEKLIVLVGGTKHDKDVYSKLFESFSNKIVYIGEVGKASAIKLALNQLIATETAAFAMSLGYLRERNVDVDMFMDILKGSALYAPTFEKKLTNYLSRDFNNPNFPLKHLLKDVKLMVSQFHQEGIDTQTLEGVEAVIKKGLEEKLGEKDYSSLYNIIHPKRD